MNVGGRESIGHDLDFPITFSVTRGRTRNWPRFKLMRKKIRSQGANHFYAPAYALVRACPMTPSSAVGPDPGSPAVQLNLGPLPDCA